MYYCSNQRHMSFFQLLFTLRIAHIWLLKFILLSLLLGYTALSPIRAQLRAIHTEQTSSNHVEKFSFYSAAEGYVAFSYDIAFTQDSGRTFIKKPITIFNVDFGNYSVNFTFGFYINGVKAFNQDNVIVYGNYGFIPAILRSTNGGNTWKLVYHSQALPNSLSIGIKEMTFAPNGVIGYAADPGRILKTTDGGISWTVVRFEPDQLYSQLEVKDANTVYALSNIYGSSRLIKSTNGGSSWQSIATPRNHLISISFLTAQKGWLSTSANSHNGLYYTSNGGSSWKLMNDTIHTSIGLPIIKFINDSTGVSSGGFYDTYLTSDSGKIWQILPRDNAFEYANFSHIDLQIWDANQFWVGGGHGFIELSTNRGGEPIPGAFFKIDTTGLFQTNQVHLINFSKPGYQYRWYRNDTLISTSYNTSYTHLISNRADSIRLVVSNGISEGSLTKYQYFRLPEPPPPPPTPYVGWKIYPNNISDDLLDIRVFGNVGVITARNGLYYTTTGIENPTGWNKFHVQGNSADSSRFEMIRFNQLAFNEKSTDFYISGNDTVNDKAVIIRFNPLTLSYSYVYTGEIGTHLNDIHVTGIQNSQGYVHAVGNQGLFVSYSLNNGILTVNSHLFVGRPDLLQIYPRANGEGINGTGIISDSTVFTGNGDYSFALTSIKHTGRNIKSATSARNNTDLLVNDTMLYRIATPSTNFSIDSIDKYKSPAPIQYTVMTSGLYGNHRYIGTNQGIYKVHLESQASLYNEAIEYQPTSLRKPITNIWFKQRAPYDTGYAIGPGGILMMTINFGGPTIPYAENNVTGNCLGQPTVLNGIHGTGTICKWYIDNTLKVTNCASSSINITEHGDHVITYIVSNEYGLSDTSKSNINIAPIPNLAVPFFVSDSVLCKAEQIIISIPATERGFIYEIVDQNGNAYGTTLGNGSQQTFISKNIFQTGYYKLRIINQQGGCSNFSTFDKFIQVEKTKSKFSSTRLNIALSESTTFVQNAIEATTYKWAFPSNASIQSYEGAITPPVSFATTGEQFIKLISISPNGCSDTLLESVVFVYNRPLQDESCYTIPINDTDISISPSIYTSIGKTAKHLDNSYIIFGEGNQPDLKTRYGRSKKIPTFDATYLAHYSGNGVLEWNHYINNEASIQSVTTDSAGYIYVTGHCRVFSQYHFNNGDSIQLVRRERDSLAFYRRQSTFIMKLDKDGNYKWHTILEDPQRENAGPLSAITPSNIEARDEYLLVTGYFTNRISYVRNNQSDTLVILPNNTGSSTNRQMFVLKIDSSGNLIWHTYFENFSSNPSFRLIGKTDKDWNIYIAGVNEFKLIVHDALGTTIPTIQTGSSLNQSFLLKFNKDGRFIWRVLSQKQNSNKIMSFKSLEVDSDGKYIYIGGDAHAPTSVDTVIIKNSDGSDSYFKNDGFIIAQFDSSGKYQWHAGSIYSSAGFTSDIAISNDRIFQVGKLINHQENAGEYIITSTDKRNLAIAMTISDFLVTSYNQHGELQQVWRTSNNQAPSVYPEKLLVDQNGNMHISASLERSLYTTYTVGNSTIDIQTPDCFIAKLNPSFCETNTPPVADAGPDRQICKGDSIQIGTASSGMYVSWQASDSSIIRTTPILLVKPDSTTTYYLASYNNAGQVSYDTVVVTVNTVLPINLIDSVAICVGQAITLGSPAEANFLYSWTSSLSGFNASTAEISVSPSTTGWYYLTVVSSAGCKASDSVKIIVNNQVNPTISISTNTTTICQGAVANFISMIQNEGPNPIITWQINAIEVGSGAQFQTTSLSNGDKVRAILKNNLTCAINSTDTSNIITITVKPVTTPSVAIIANSTNICPGGSAIVKAQVNDMGNAIYYSWYKNGVSNNGGEFGKDSVKITGLQNGDQVYVKATSNPVQQCAASQSAVSNILTFSTVQPVPVSASIAGNNIVIQGYPTILTASGVNIGPWPVYEWQDSTGNHTWQTISNSNQSSYQYTPVSSGDKIRCKIYSSLNCVQNESAFSNSIIFVINTPTAVNPQPAESLNIRYYPNPATHMLILDSLHWSDHWVNIGISNTLGGSKIISYSLTGKTKIELPVFSLPAGIYFAILRNRSGRTAYFKFIKL